MTEYNYYNVEWFIPSLSIPSPFLYVIIPCLIAFAVIALTDKS